MGQKHAGMTCHDLRDLSLSNRSHLATRDEGAEMQSCESIYLEQKGIELFDKAVECYAQFRNEGDRAALLCWASLTLELAQLDNESLVFIRREVIETVNMIEAMRAKA